VHERHAPFPLPHASSSPRLDLERPRGLRRSSLVSPLPLHLSLALQVAARVLTVAATIAGRAQARDAAAVLSLCQNRARHYLLQLATHLALPFSCFRRRWNTGAMMTTVVAMVAATCARGHEATGQ
jgi:hypothetical protein